MIMVFTSESYYPSGDYMCNITINDSEYKPTKFAIQQKDFPTTEISGSGDTYESDSFDIAGGLVVTEFSNTGEGFFRSMFQNEESTWLGNVIEYDDGDISGKSGAYVQKGLYSMQVASNGDWKFIISQPREFETQELPYPFTGDKTSLSKLILIGEDYEKLKEELGIE